MGGSGLGPKDSEWQARLMEGQHLLLEQLAQGRPTEHLLDHLCRLVESLATDAICSVLILGKDGQSLYHGAGPGLPPEYVLAIDGALIGPKAGSCGTAAFENRTVLVEDISTDPLWDDYRTLAMPHGLAACVSLPIRGLDGRVLGTFALYHRNSGPFEPRELALLEDTSDLAAVVLRLQQRDEALRLSEARYRAVVEQAGEMIFFFDVTTKRIVEANAAFQQTLGYSDEDLETLTLYDLVDADRESVDRNVARVVTDQHYNVGRRRYRHKDSRIREVEASASHLREIDQDLLCAVAHDVTDQVRAEAALRQAQKLESLGLLAGGVAHDFNNLLTAILGNLNLAQMNLPKTSPILPYLSNIEGTVLRAADLTRQMLTYSGRGRFLIQAVNLGQVVDEMTHLLTVSISKKVVLHSQIPEALPALEGDPTQIQQIVMNLVINASEAIGDAEGSITITARAAILDEFFISNHLPGQAVKPGSHVIFEVSDTGDGMGPEIISRVFDPFFTTKVSGRGLGLSAMLGILRSHHAGINIYSEIGRGSTFRIYFPAHQAVKKSSQPPKRPIPRNLPTGTVLVVDDESTIRATTGAMLESLGFKVLDAADGIEAVELYKTHSKDIILVLLDLTMPRMDGKAALHAIQEMNPFAKVILSSGYDQEEALQPFIGANLVGFLKKPYQYKDLVAELEKVLI